MTKNALPSKIEIPKMRPQTIIEKKRDGTALNRAEIGSFIQGVTAKTWADYQISALLMAFFLRGLNAEESAFLTEAMLASGETLDFSDIGKPVADKHSTGGVGDKTSLIIAPLAAACGLAVPMISGRGLGHTGGTLDKLEAIKGYSVKLSLDEFRAVIEKCGFAMTGQTAEIAPADKKLYALRDATATVEYIPLIVASIMSKKLAEGLNALVLDVKTGSGAFMKTLEKSRELAEKMCAVGAKFGVNTRAVISDMSQPLGKFVGNACEVYECIKIMRGEDDELMRPTRDLSISLTAQMLYLAKICKDLETAEKLCAENLANGTALEKFRQNIALQNGVESICDAPETLLAADVRKFAVKAENKGFVTEINTKKLGEAVVAIGGGRAKVEDEIDFAVGFECSAKIGDEVSNGDALGSVLCRNSAQFEQIRSEICRSFIIGGEKLLPLKLIGEIVG